MKIINEVNLPFVPRKLLLECFEYVKIKFLSLSFKYSIATQKKHNSDNNLNQDFGFNEIKTKFKKLGLNKLDDSNFKIIDIDYRQFPINYQKRLKESLPLQVKIYTFRKGFPAGVFNDDELDIGIKLNYTYRYFILKDKNKKIEKEVFGQPEFGYRSYSISMFGASNINSYYKDLTSTLEHEIIHYIEEILNHPKKFTNAKVKSPEFKGSGNFSANQEENYFDSNVEFKTQILNVYRELTKYFKSFKMTYQDILDIEYNIFTFAKIFTSFTETAFNEKRNLIRIKTLLNLLYKNSRLKRDIKQEKIFIKKLQSILKKKYKQIKKWDKKDKLMRTKKWQKK